MTNKKTNDIPKPTIEIAAELPSSTPGNELEGRISMMIPPPPMNDAEESDDSDWG